MTIMGDTKVTARNKCRKEKCRFYDSLSEASCGGCMYGASVEDKESERACVEKEQK